MTGRPLARNAGVREEIRIAASALRRAAYLIGKTLFSDVAVLQRKNNIKINIGCGRLTREGWINLDLYAAAGAYYADVRNGLPFASHTVRHIHCEHFLEHLSFEDAEKFLCESYRVLVRGASMRIIVPDAEKYLVAYCRQDAAFFNALSRLGGAQSVLDTPMKVINQMFRMGGDHRFAWDFETLRGAAVAAGFTEVTRSWAGDVAEDLAIDGTDEWRKVESLYAMLRK